MARRHRRCGRRDEPQQRQRRAEDPRGAAAQRRAADRGACAGPPAADHPLALPPACPAAARRRDRHAPAGRLRAGRQGRGEGGRWRGSAKAASAARSSSPAPAAWTSTARWSTCWRPCPSSTWRACTASPNASPGAARRPTPAWRSLNYLFDGWLKGLARHAALGGEAAASRAVGERPARRACCAAASLDRWMEAWEKVARLLSRADAVNLDRKQTVLGSFLVLQSAMR